MVLQNYHGKVAIVRLILLVVFPVAGGRSDTLSVFVKVVNLAALALRNILFVFQLFQFFAHGQLFLFDNGQNKSDQLFTVDRLLSAYSFFKSSYASQNCFLPVIFD